LVAPHLAPQHTSRTRTPLHHLPDRRAPIRERLLLAEQRQRPIRPLNPMNRAPSGRPRNDPDPESHEKAHGLVGAPSDGWADAKDDYAVLEGEKSVGRIYKERAEAGGFGLLTLAHTRLLLPTTASPLHWKRRNNNSSNDM
jgi:hypothetical protein